MTMSHLADMIIVFSFIGVMGAFIGSIAAELTGIAVKKIRAIREKYKKEDQ